MDISSLSSVSDTFRVSLCPLRSTEGTSWVLGIMFTLCLDLLEPTGLNLAQELRYKKGKYCSNIELAVVNLKLILCWYLGTTMDKTRGGYDS